MGFGRTGEWHGKEKHSDNWIYNIIFSESVSALVFTQLPESGNIGGYGVSAGVQHSGCQMGGIKADGRTGGTIREHGKGRRISGEDKAA